MVTLNKTVLLFAFLILAPTYAFSQKKKVIYQDTLQNTMDILGYISIQNTGRYKMKVDESDPKIRVFKPVPTTKSEFDSLVDKTEQRFTKHDIIGKTISAFDVVDINGRRYNSSDLKGKVLVFNFWFVGCGPCEVEMAELNQLVERYKHNDNVVFLSFAKSPEAKVRKFLTKNEFKYPVTILLKDQFETYKLGSFPTNAIIDKQGVCSFASSGIGIGGVHILRKYLDKALSESSEKL